MRDWGYEWGAGDMNEGLVIGVKGWGEEWGAGGRSEGLGGIGVQGWG